MSALQLADPPATRTPRRRRRRNTGIHASGFGAWPLVLPAMLPVMIFSLYPLLQGIGLGFTDARAGLDVITRFNGLDNYAELAGDRLFWQSFRIGVIWTLGVTVLQFLAALGLALLLNLDLRFRWVARTLALVPWAMPPVIIAIMWRMLLNPSYGGVGQLMELVGLPGNINFLGSFAIALPTVIVIGVWAGMPQTTVVLLAGLQAVPNELREAAAIDGAGTWARFWNVTVPALRPTIIAITTLDLIWNFNSFALVYVLTQGGPGGRTMLPMLFAYSEAFRYGNFGYAAAMGNVMVILIGIFLTFYLRAQSRSQS